MTGHGGDEGGGWLDQVVEVWIDNNDTGQSIFLTGERPDGQRFFGSFFQPTLNSNNDNNSDDGEEQW